MGFKRWAFNIVESFRCILWISTFRGRVIISFKEDSAYSRGRIISAKIYYYLITIRSGVVIRSRFVTLELCRGLPLSDDRVSVMHTTRRDEILKKEKLCTYNVTWELK